MMWFHGQIAKAVKYDTDDLYLIIQLSTSVNLFGQGRGLWKVMWGSTAARRQR